MEKEQPWYSELKKKEEEKREERRKTQEKKKSFGYKVKRASKKTSGFLYPKKVYGRSRGGKIVRTSRKKGRKTGSGTGTGMVSIFGRIASPRRRRR